MMQAFAEGLSIGLLLSAMIGPVFFTLIQNSLENGFRYAAVLALGILVSDLIYVILTYLSVSIFASNPHFEVVLGFVGGLVLVGFGVSTLLKKASQPTKFGRISTSQSKKADRLHEGFQHQWYQSFCDAILDFHRRLGQSQRRVWKGRSLAVLHGNLVDCVCNRPAQSLYRQAAFPLCHRQAHGQAQLPCRCRPHLFWRQVDLVCLGKGLVKVGQWAVENR
jgi:hypothetical protein